jgi:hypothetical protein
LDYAQEHDPEETEAFKAVREKNENLKMTFSKLLEEFYRQRSSASDRFLGIQVLGSAGHFKVEHVGESFFKNITDDQMASARAELANEQAEMTRFVEFLRERYFAEAN